MFCPLVLFGTTILAQSSGIERDSFGVPHVYGRTWKDAFFQAGYAVAEDRLWQIDNSRKIARGKMAADFGSSFAASDTEALKNGYTDEEYTAQFEKFSPKLKEAFRSYAEGVNAYVADATAKGNLPEGYKQIGHGPARWSEIDSVAIAVRLFQLFGRFDPGELRNYALYQYFKTQPVKDRAIDVWNDFLPYNDKRSPTTVPEKYHGSSSTIPSFPKPTTAITQNQLAALPQVSLLELMPAIRSAEHNPQALAAEVVSAPFKAGSYAIVVGSGRSATSAPILLSAPQMGWQTPSIIHEMSIEAPGLKVVGMDIPGVPGIAIGHSDRFAWALTSGIADTDDIVYFPKVGSDYMIGSQRVPIQEIRRELQVGSNKSTVIARRTVAGPIVLETKDAVFCRKSASRGRELESLDTFFALYNVSTESEMMPLLKSATVNFNFFYAFANGQIGYSYLGLIPKRRAHIDPRLPYQSTPENDWDGFIPFDQMPRVKGADDLVITNWNNKPAAWWPNQDTPTWGRLFRVESLNRALPMGKLTTADVEFAAWSIARSEFTAPVFVEQFRKAVPAPTDPMSRTAWQHLASYDGRAIAGSIAAMVYNQYLSSLRDELFLSNTGSFFSPDLYQTAVQPSLILAALNGESKFNYRGKRSAAAIQTAAFEKAVSRLKSRYGETIGLWQYVPGGIAVSGETAIPYGNRGTYIQVVELLGTPNGRNVVSPGVAERGVHSSDQVPLARAWTYKPMRFSTKTGRQ